MSALCCQGELAYSGVQPQCQCPVAHVRFASDHMPHITHISFSQVTINHSALLVVYPSFCVQSSRGITHSTHAGHAHIMFTIVGRLWCVLGRQSQSGTTACYLSTCMTWQTLLLLCPPACPHPARSGCVLLTQAEIRSSGLFPGVYQYDRCWYCTTPYNATVYALETYWHNADGELCITETVCQPVFTA